MADFDLAIPVILKHEGGYVSDPADPGGETKYGISRHSYPNLDIASLTPEDAAAIYKRDFWHYDAIKDQAVATKVFDLAVNCGTKSAIRMLQQAIINCGETIAMDGAFGPVTIAACNACDPIALLHEIKNEALAHYRALTVTNPALAKFLTGWTKRALS